MAATYRVRSFRPSFRTSVGTHTQVWQEFSEDELSDEQIEELENEPLIEIQVLPDFGADISNLKAKDGKDK